MVRRKRAGKASARKARKPVGRRVRTVKSLKTAPHRRSARKSQAVTVASARRFIDRIQLPPTPARKRSTASLGFETEIVHDSSKDASLVVGSSILSFVKGVTAERREAIVNSSLLAQLAANRAVPDSTKMGDWFKVYFGTLQRIGWVIQGMSMTDYGAKDDNVEAHEAILTVAASLLGTAPAALALVNTTLKALKEMNKDSPWITLFSRQSQHAHTAHFQVGLAEEDAAGQFWVYLMALEIKARSMITQVLFFKFRHNEATMRHHAGRVSINSSVLAKVGEEIKTKIVQYASDYIKALPI